MTYIAIIFTAIFTQNFVLQKFLGICPFLGVSKKKDTAVGMSAAVIFVMVLAAAVCYPINKYLLVANGFEYLQTLVFILVIAALVQFVEIAMKKYMKPLYNALGIFLPLITTNCAVLGVAITVVTKEFTFGLPSHMLNLGEALVYAFATSLGYGLAMVIFAGIREHLALSDVPKAFKGVPIALVSVGILAMAFMGFSGMVK